MIYRLINADVLDGLALLADESIDAVACDPPYELGFMGKSWDSTGIAYSVPMWREVRRVLKPGGHLLAFGGSRTYHRMACAIEDAGFEIRDQLQWLYGSGFPKSLDVSKAIDRARAEPRVVGTRAVVAGVAFEQSSPYASGRTEIPITEAATAAAAALQGWGTALKPAHEPLVLARKPFRGTVAANVLAHGTGAMNIDGCRIGTTVETWPASRSYAPGQMQPGHAGETEATGPVPPGRWPANVLLDEEAAAILDEQSGIGTSNPNPNPNYQNTVYGRGMGGVVSLENQHGGTGGVSRFFYTAKSSRSEREEGLYGLPLKSHGMSGGASSHVDSGSDYGAAQTIGLNRIRKVANNHPTVKPVDLMRWLVRLVTPRGGTVLDPFLGSGTTGMAAIAESFDFIGIEKEAEYVKIARLRIASIAPLLARERIGAESARIGLPMAPGTEQTDVG